MVIVPPKTTAGTTPINRAAKPLSKAPNSLDEIMKILLREETLPFMFSGVFNCSTVDLTITLIPSNTPEINKA
ncbi:MAG: hypothetical protein RJB42_733, partial [Bacteroidota bacterium]